MNRNFNLKPAKRFKADTEFGFQFDCLSGVSGHDDGTSCYVWALFNRKDIPQSMIDQHLDEDYSGDYDLAYHLTQWEPYSNGVGRWFGSEPTCKIGRNHILVKQFRAMDI